MKFEIRMGIPEMEAYWHDLCDRAESNCLGNDRKLVKVLQIPTTIAFPLTKSNLFPCDMELKFGNRILKIKHLGRSDFLGVWA